MMKRCLAGILCLLLLFSCAAAEKLDRDVLLSYFDDCVLFGDSITQGLRRYRSAERERDPGFLEGLTLVCTSSISLFTASRRFRTGEQYFKYKGVRYTLYEIARLLKPRVVFILLGLNDEVGLKIDKALEWVRYLTHYVHEFSPDSGVCFISLTPVTRAYCRSVGRTDYQEKLNEYNRRLRETCLDMGVSYMEIAEPLKGEDGYIASAYVSDGLVHLTDEGASVWIQCMCDYAQEQFNAGLWTPAAAE